MDTIGHNSVTINIVEGRRTRSARDPDCMRPASTTFRTKCRSSAVRECPRGRFFCINASQTEDTDNRRGERENWRDFCDLDHLSASLAEAASPWEPEPAQGLGAQLLRHCAKPAEPRCASNRLSSRADRSLPHRPTPALRPRMREARCCSDRGKIGEDIAHVSPMLVQYDCRVIFSHPEAEQRVSNVRPISPQCFAARFES